MAYRALWVGRESSAASGGPMMEVNDFDNDPKAGYNKVETRGEYQFEE